MEIERKQVDLTKVKESGLPVVWVIGGPGCGKGTQCDHLRAKYGYVHLAAGELLRHEVMSGSKRGLQLYKLMEMGELVPVEVVLDLLSEAMASKVTGSSGFLIDGYPLDLEEAEKFEKQVVPVTRIIHLDLSTDTMVDRLTRRGNFDDKPETVLKRVKLYEEKTVPVLEKYCNKTVKVDADRSAVDIYPDIID
ncbi:adenylate kinase isoenzyme 1 isoform X2 [Eurytemora carolleeae]|uniref:adenylate kinase isoenzyme 1 isoform X2 n=1 Tax=Eurytemora carolleeae TaxID=1294199 RepID=UPI000C7846C1|nr:adenylate kinase isoenzyme 1 isoform X2 [Eurytemora carolleeae]|eukprot:XP_023332154.1 adenylate kinase isoenzyme 1-like isoform X2 [Eurytemora affinis]